MGRKSRQIPEINAGAMADIAFLLLVFFLVTTTIDTDSGIARKLPPMPDKSEILDPPKIKKNNILVVLADAKGRILYRKNILKENGECCDGEDIEVTNDLTELENVAKKFITNENVDPLLSVNPQKAIISLQSTFNTPYQTYINVQNSLAKVYKEIRNNEAIKTYGKNYTRLDKEQQTEIRKKYPQKISEAEPKR